MFALILLSLLACLVLTLRAQIKEAKLPKLPPAMPGALPLIGHTHQLITDTIGFWRVIKQYSIESLKLGGVCYTQFGRDIHYVISDPEDVLTAANACLQKHNVYDFAKKWIGDGLITGSGEIYKRHRKLMNPAFTSSMTHGFLGVFNRQARDLVDKMSQHVEKEPFNPSVLINRVIMEISCLALFGSDIEDKKFLHKYEIAVKELMYLITQRFQKPYLASNLLYKLMGYKKREDLLVTHLHELSCSVIQKQKALAMDIDVINNQETQYKTFLEFFIGLSKKNLMSDKEIIEEIDTILVASFDTTSFTLTILMVLLGTYPQIQEKIYEELLQVVGDDKDLKKDDLEKLRYTKAVINETLRILPPAPVVARYVDTDIKLKNYTMRAGSYCVLSIYGMQHHKVWGPDADQFKPERWLDSEVNTYNYGAFSLGKRSCVGKSFGLMMLRILLVQLVREYQWTADISKVVWKNDVTLKPASGHEIKIQPRTK